MSAGTATIQYTVIQNGCTSITTAPITVNSKQNHSVTISVSDNNTCHGTSVTFTANAINSGASPIYQWKKNGNNINNANGPTYTYALNAGDIITCEVTSNDDCVTPLTAVSNSITMSESETVPLIIISVTKK
jgi:hypothetical protein